MEDIFLLVGDYLQSQDRRVLALSNKTLYKLDDLYNRKNDKVIIKQCFFCPRKTRKEIILSKMPCCKQCFIKHKMNIIELHDVSSNNDWFKINLKDIF